MDFLMTSRGISGLCRYMLAIFNLLSPYLFCFTTHGKVDKDETGEFPILGEGPADG